AEQEYAQLAATVGEVERDPGIGHEIDVDLVEVGLPAEVDGAARTVAELTEVSLHRGAVERTLLGLEIAGVDERVGARRAELGVRQPRIGRHAVRDGEPRARRRVRAALVAG